MAQKYQIVSLLWTLISQAWNGLLRHFQCLKSSAGNPLAVEKGPGSIAPLRAELWPFKEGTRQICLKIEANVTDFVTTFSNAHISGLEWSFAKIQKPQIISWALASHRKRTQVNCTSGSRAMAIQRGQPSEEFLQIWWKSLICVQTLISQAWSGVLQKFKNLEPSEWSALAMEQWPRTVAPLEGKLHPVKVGNRHRIFTNFVQLTVSWAWNGLFQKFKRLKSIVWSAWAFGKRTKLHNTQESQERGFRIRSGGYLFRVFILACC